MKKTKEFYRGCLVGGAVGDALGAPVRFMTLTEIKEKYGECGINNIVLGRKGRAELTENTQLTLFTAEGLLRAECRGNNIGVSDVLHCMYHSYLRWTYTQGLGVIEEEKDIYDGILIKQKDFYTKKINRPNYLISIINGEIGVIEKPINLNRDCRGIMRVAPIGLFYRPNYTMNKATDCVAITHGDHLAQISAGIFTYIISDISVGVNIEDAIEDSIKELSKYNNVLRIKDLIEKAKVLATNKKSDEICIKELGNGWLPEEMLAIAVFCSLRYKNNFEQAIIAAVNIDGDSSTVASMVGNILGIYLGISKVPKKWSNKVELIDILLKISDDLLIGYCDESEWWSKYPAY